MTTLASIVPDLVAEVGAALASQGRGDLVPQLAEGILKCCTYDASVDAGYIFLVRPAHLTRLPHPVAETIPFLEVGFNVDIAHDGCLFGIEILHRLDFFSQLRKANAL